MTSPSKTPSGEPSSAGWPPSLSPSMVPEGRATRWIIYVRRSYKEATAADVSDDQQEASARALVPAGAHVVVISDSGGHHSGRSDDRDGYRDLIAQVRDGRVAGIAVFDLSRLARNARLMLNLKAELDQRQVELRVATLPGSQFDGATGRFMFGQVALAAQLMADQLSEQQTGMLRRIFEDGRHRGQDPFGYRGARDKNGDLVHPRQLLVVPKEAEVVRQVWSDLQHHSFDDVAERMNRQGVPHRTRRPWTRDAVKDIWRRGRVYLGYVVEKRGLDERPGRHEPIVDEATYRATVAAVHARTRAGNKPKPFRIYLLRGVIRCGCGSPMRGEARVQRAGERRYYRCPVAGRHIVKLDGRGAAVRCDARLVPADAAEQAVLDEIGTAVLPAGVIEAAREELRRRLSAPADGLVDRQRKRLETRLAQLRKQHEWGDITDDVYRAARSETHTALAQLPDGDKLVLFDRNRRVLGSLAANVAAATPAQRAELVSLLVESTVARDGRIDPAEISWTPPARPFFAARWLVCPQGDSNP
jgi:DNA invertase Pin-like site-specific DNA recombinase